MVFGTCERQRLMSGLPSKPSGGDNIQEAYYLQSETMWCLPICIQLGRGITRCLAQGVCAELRG